MRDNLIAVLGVSTKYRNFSDPYIRLPADRRTQLTADCAVILNWFAILAIPDDCEFLIGDVPSKLMLQINEGYRELLRSELAGMHGTLAQSLRILRPRS